MSVLKPKTVNTTRTISVRVPAELYADLEEVRKAADSHGMTFDVAGLVEKTLTAAVKSARAELARLKVVAASQPSSSGGGDAGETSSPVSASAGGGSGAVV